MRGYELAYMIAEKAFEKKKDLSGNPYMEHLETVASGFPDNSEQKTVAILHDLLEDCPEWNEKSLRALFYDSIVNSIVALTKNDDELYTDYIHRVWKDNTAKRVKIADLKHNMDITRLNKITDKDVCRLRKYLEAYKYLTK